jgi:hypothetical protein
MTREKKIFFLPYKSIFTISFRILNAHIFDPATPLWGIYPTDTFVHL